MTQAPAHALLDGKVVVVTGAGRSLGEITAELCAAEGATVIRTDITGEAGTDVVPHDVTQEGDWQRVVADVVAAHGRVDGLVNNAAIIWPSRPFLDEPPEEFRKLLDINVMGTVLGMQAAARAMIEAGTGGSIVNISSTAGMTAHQGISSYGTSKWAVRGLTKYGANELGPSGIRVNSVHPGGMMGTTMFPGTFDQTAYDFAARKNPLRRVVDASDVADAVVWLLSDLSHNVTGREMVVDAGATSNH
jgi:3alpha(or 20beta)-hydroxysteroid dehydrogenase